MRLFRGAPQGCVRGAPKACRVLPTGAPRLRPTRAARTTHAAAAGAAAAAEVSTNADNLSAIVPLEGGARLDFIHAEWVADLVSGGFGSGSAPLLEGEDDDDERAWEELPQGYRCADNVAVHSVPMMDQQPAYAAGAGLGIPPGAARLVVSKVSHYRDPDTDKMDMFKFASMTNEWSTFAKHAGELQASKYLVQLLGHSKSRSTYTIVSEFCNGGDLQACMDQQSQLQQALDPQTSLAPAVGDAAATSTSTRSAEASGAAKQAPRELRLQAGGRMSEAQVARVATHVLKGLAALHRAGLTHGDIKPANVFINTEPRSGSSTSTSSNSKRVVLKLGDFGTTREKGRQHLHYFVSGFGYSPEYASPEALHGTGKAGMASDLWSLGIMLVQLLLGHLPDLAVSMVRMQSPDSHRDRETYLSQHPPGEAVLRELDDAHVPTSPALRQVLARCLQVAPSMRPLDASALLLFDFFVQRQQQQQVGSRSSMGSMDSSSAAPAASATLPQLAQA